MTAIRPDMPAVPTSMQGPGASAVDARRAFFGTALAQATGAVAPAAQALATVEAAQVHAAQPADTTERLSRPGALLDIRV